MTTLTESPLAPLLDRLFNEADVASADIATVFADLSDDDQDRLVRSKTGYRDLYGRLKNVALAVSPETGTLLYMVARSAGAKTIVEFGTSFGISTLHLAAALRDNGGGRLITCEFEPSKAARARANLTAGGLIDLVEIREGDALETLSVDLPQTIDLVLLDGAKGLYPDILRLLKKICGRARSSSPTTPMTAPSIWRACARPRMGTSPCRLPQTSNCRCGLALS